MSYRIIKICTPEIFVPYMDSGTVATLPEWDLPIKTSELAIECLEYRSLLKRVLLNMADEREVTICLIKSTPWKLCGCVQI
jgi:hypothetical protein